jgi:hypothetical protein
MAKEWQRHAGPPDTVVLGMHRSGTSALAGSLARLGLCFGPDSSLLPANPDNSKGYFESRTLVEISDWLLQEQGAAWWRPSAFDPNRTEPETRAAAVHAYQEGLGEIGRGFARGVKDPRLCLTLEVLLPALHRPLVVMIWRKPQAVAASLKRRDTFPLHFGLALWEYYTIRAARSAVGLAAIAVANGDLLSSPVATLRRVADHLEAHSVPLRREALEGEAARFVDRELSQIGDNAADVKAIVSQEQSRIAEAMADGDLSAVAAMSVSESALMLLNDFAAYHGLVSAMASDLRNARVDARQLRETLDAVRLEAQAWAERAKAAEEHLAALCAPDNSRKRA